MDWGSWEAFADSVGQQLSDVDRATARRHFEALMNARPDRHDQLVDLLARNGVGVSFGDDGLQALDDWYQAHVQADREEPERLSPRWYAVGLDIGLFLGDAIIERAPSVAWRLYTHGRRDAAYHRPVLMGFQAVQNPRYNVDPERLVGTHGHRLIAQLDEPRALFVQVVHGAVAKA